VNRASLSFCATRRTRSSSLDTLNPALCPGRVSLAAFPLAGPLSSTISAAPPWALFDGFSGTTGPSDFPRSSITGLRPWPSPHDPSNHHQQTGDRGISRFSSMERSFFDPVGSADGSRKRRQRCCLPSFSTASAPQTFPFRGSISRLRAPLANASLRPRGTPTHGSGPP
jgi:hypothetical protein